MGSCVSLHRDPESVMKLRLSVGSKNEKLFIPSPVKQNSDTVNVAVAQVTLKSEMSRAFTGSKDEAFFDSQPWLDSDCEDDYYSVNGDFTPADGNTPVHHSFPLGKLQVNKTPAAAIEGTIDGAPEPYPPDKKKRLSELFNDSLRINQPVNGENAKVEAEATNSLLVPKSANGTPCLSGTNSGRSSERTPNGEGKSVKSAQCCLLGLLSSHSFSERKKKKDDNESCS